MPITTVLLCLAVSEPGLRSTLAAQLSMPRIDLVTAGGVDGPGLRRSVRRPAVLILDAETVASNTGAWLDDLLAEPHWRSIMVVTRDTIVPDNDNRIEYVAKAAVPARIAERVPAWLAEDVG